MRVEGTLNQRGKLTSQAKAVQEISKMEAQKRYLMACDTIRVLGGDAPESVWHEKRQMLAILNMSDSES